MCHVYDTMQNAAAVQSTQSTEALLLPAIGHRHLCHRLRRMKGQLAIVYCSSVLIRNYRPYQERFICLPVNSAQYNLKFDERQPSARRWSWRHLVMSLKQRLVSGVIFSLD